MKLSSANLIALGQRELRAKGEKCDPACFVWYGCGNSKPDGLCEGFILLDGETKRHLHKLLSEEDEKYVTNCVRMLQSGSNEEALVQEVLRYVPEAERQPKEMGFTAMLTAARSSNPTSQHTEPAEPCSRSGFIRMLEASSKNTSSEDAVQRALAEIEQDEAKYRRQSSELTRRGMGFGNMFKASQTGTFEGDETRDDVKPIPYGLAAMLEAMSPNRTHGTLSEKSGVHRGMGFRAMLDGAGKGTE